MKAEELMIGDWVIRGNIIQEPMRITDICASKNNVYLDLSGIPVLEKISKIQPIPITPEILEKNEIEADPVVYSVYRHEDFSIAYDIDENGKYYWAFCMVNYYNEANICIHYVHELQHALKLCKIDKEIVL